MKIPSEPQINKNNPKKWFIYWNHDVPVELWDKYDRKRIRIIKIGDINEYQGEEREKYAEQYRQIWSYSIFALKYSPFDEELQLVRTNSFKTKDTKAKIQQVQAIVKDKEREMYPIDKALHQYMLSRKSRKLSKSTVAAYQSSVDWINEGLTFTGHGTIRIGQIKHIHVTEALDYIAEDREWSATTINKEMGRIMTIFNWMETEDYFIKNPCRGKFIPLPTNKSINTWYDRETAAATKKAVKLADKDKVYRAMQFTYWLLIRSKEELRKLKIGDIDRTLKRVRFSSDLSKNKKEQYRDYPDEFEQVLNEMKLDQYPGTYYVFGKNDGMPGEYQCGHNYFSKQFKVIKDRVGLSADYTIYGWKHTRIVHELMKGTDGREISHMARHSDFKTTKEYLRDYDITLKNIYIPEDLTF